MTTKATTITQARAVETVVLGSLATKRKVLNAQAKAAKAAEKAAKSGTKVRHGIRQLSSIELNAIVRGVRGDVTKVLAADVRAKVTAYRTAKANTLGAMASGDIDSVRKCVMKEAAAKSAARVALKEWKSKQVTLCSTKLDTIVAIKAAAIVRSFAILHSDDNDAALRIGTFNAEGQKEVRKALSDLIEVAAKYTAKTGNRNNYRA